MNASREVDPALKTRALSASEAVSCCEKEKNKFSAVPVGIASDFLRGVLEGPPERGWFLALVPTIVPTVAPTGPTISPWSPPTVKWVPPGPLVVGSVVLLGATFLLDAATQLAAIETATALLRAIEKGVKEARDVDSTCEKCIRGKMWTDRNKQEVVAVVSKRRIGALRGWQKRKAEKDALPKKAE